MNYIILENRVAKNESLILQTATDEIRKTVQVPQSLLIPMYYSEKYIEITRSPPIPSQVSKKKKKKMQMQKEALGIFLFWVEFMLAWVSFGCSILTSRSHFVTATAKKRERKKMERGRPARVRETSIIL